MGRISKKEQYKDRHRVNDQIRVPDVRLINEKGEQLGVVATPKALELALAVNQDLVEVSPKSVPPVCRIIDYGKFVYQQSKRAHEAKKKQRAVHLKEVKMGPNIDEHDLMIKMKHARDFLGEGDKVKVTLKFRTQELRQEERGWAVVDRFLKEVSDVGQIDTEPKKEMRQINAVLSPKSKKKGS